MPPKAPTGTTHVRLARIVELVRAQGIPIRPTDRDGKALKGCAAPPELIAAAYCAVARPRSNPGAKWGDDWMRENLSLRLVIERLAGFEALEAERRYWQDLVTRTVERDPEAWAGPAVDGDPPDTSPTATEAGRIWEAALRELRLGMSVANFESYLVGTAGVAFEDDELTVTVGNPLVRDTLEQRFRQHILRALFDVVGRPCRLRLADARQNTSSDSRPCSAAAG